MLVPVASIHVLGMQKYSCANTHSVEILSWKQKNSPLGCGGQNTEIADTIQGVWEKPGNGRDAKEMQ